jgi:CheY-like chemotaxis protein
VTEHEQVRVLIEKLGLEVTVRQLAGAAPPAPPAALESAEDPAERMELVARFAGGIAHDLNNLLTAIAGYSELILTRMSESNPLRRDAIEIENAVERASELTRRLLAVARRRMPRAVVQDPNALLSSLEPHLREAAGDGVELVLSVDARARKVRVGQGQLEEIVLLLVESARAAMGGEGRIQIETAPSEGAGERVRISVTDSAPPPPEGARIFEPFVVEEGEGRGAGLLLAAAYGMALQNDGTIGVAPGESGGTTFTLELPGLSAVEGGGENPISVESRETVLLAEDEDPVRFMVRETLERRGYRVLEARDGVEALGIAARFDGAIDLLLTDVGMPGMNGVELATALRPRRPQMRVLYMSGSPAEAVARDLELQAGTGFVAKPVTPSALASRVRESLDEPLNGVSIVGL